jgi:hypothetical protein
MVPSPTAILTSLLVALAATLGTLVVHGLVVHTIIMTLRRDLQRGVLGERIWVNLRFIMGATLLAFFGHLGEIALWGFALYMTGAVADIGAALFISRQLHDCRFRHRTAATVEADGTIRSGVRNADVRRLDRVHFRRHPTPDPRPVRRRRQVPSLAEGRGLLQRETSYLSSSSSG